MKLSFVDTHCHIHMEEFDQDRDEVIRRARQTGVVAIVTSSITRDGFWRARRIVNSYQGYVHHSLGLDPSIVDFKIAREMMELAEEYYDKIIAIGEVGLDYWRVKDPGLRERQKLIFIEWIKLAKKLDKPIVVHSRSAGKYAIEILLRYSATRVLMHAFDGRPSRAKLGVLNGFYFSIPPSVNYSNQKMKLAKNIPLENLVLETDSPVLAPERGVRNEPANIVYSARKISELKGIELKEVAKATTRNAEELYNMEFTA